MTLAQSSVRLALVLPDGCRVVLDRPLTIGRAREASVRIPDPTVSRTHARITIGIGGAVIEDAGSRFGIKVSDRLLTGPTLLRPGTVLRLGDVAIDVEAEPPSETPAVPLPQAAAAPASGAGATVRVPVDATALGLRPAPPARPGENGANRPRVRSGWALKRLAEEEGAARFVLQDLRMGTFVRMDPRDAALFDLLDGTRTVPELLRDAEHIAGPGGAARLTRLVADLADRGMLDGVACQATAVGRPPAGGRLFRPRERSVTWVRDYFPRAYQHWGRAFFHPLSVTVLCLLALAGFGAFAYLVGARYGTPFVVAHRVVIGGAVFIAGRLAVVTLHELAHGFALAHYGRRATRAGLRLLLIFPYAFVDTSEAYFESRPRRIVISAAGPASDLTLGAIFACACAASPPGAIRDVLFQLAFGAYVGAFFNLNPFLQRDGYAILVDFLREPKLRQRARRQLTARIAGAAQDERSSPILGRYAIAGVIWSAVGAALAVVFSNRYYDSLKRLMPPQLLLVVFAVFWLMLCLPVVMQLGLPAARRVRFGRQEANRVIS